MCAHNRKEESESKYEMPPVFPAGPLFPRQFFTPGYLDASREYQYLRSFYQGEKGNALARKFVWTGLLVVLVMWLSIVGLVVHLSSSQAPEHKPQAAPEASKISGRPAGHEEPSGPASRNTSRIRKPGDGLILQLCKPGSRMLVCCLPGAGLPDAALPEGKAAICFCSYPFGSDPGPADGGSSTPSGRAAPKPRTPCDQWFGLDIARV